jgi:hypothetical protein
MYDISLLLQERIECHPLVFWNIVDMDRNVISELCVDFFER